MNDGSLLSLLLTLKDNVMYNTNVAEVMKVNKINEDLIYCSEINSSKANCACCKLQDLNISINDIVLVLFTNTDFRANLKKIKNNQPTQDTNNRCEHSKSYGVIIGIIYGGNNEE